MRIQENYDLKDKNTLKLSARAKYFVVADTLTDVLDLLKADTLKGMDRLFLGEGSNTLFTRDYDGVVIQIGFKGKDVIRGDEKSTTLRVAAGENWHDLVGYTVENNWGGIENLALIPGLVGAAPVQNIAAYGQDISDVIESVEYLDLETLALKKISKDECQFGYRDSIFKHSLKGKALITSVELCLSKSPDLETSYYSIGSLNDSLKKELEAHKTPLTIADVYQAVINIRTRKLLDWKTEPTVGSFFINPVISKDELKQLQERIPDLQFYPVNNLEYKKNEELESDSFVKVPVGRLLDHLGWKGREVGNCMVTDKLASILTHNGNATGKEFLDFSEAIKADVKDKLGIDLESEVNII